MSQSQVAEAIGLHHFQVARFLKDNKLESLSSKDYRLHKMEREKSFSGRGGGNDIKVIPINVASTFWMNQAFNGNLKAQSLAYACIQEALQRRCDTAFQQVKDEEEYEDIAVNNRASWQESRRFLLDAHDRVYPLKKVSFKVS